VEKRTRDKMSGRIKKLSLEAGVIKIIHSCVSDCPYYNKSTCGCYLLGLKSYGMCGNDPDPRATPPLPNCPLSDYEGCG